MCSLEDATTDPVRMNTLASVAAGPMVGAKCHLGEQTYAMGRLELGPNGTRGFRGVKHTEEHDRKERHNYLGSGLSEGDNTPTPALRCIYRY
jgi:hypothetical protein